MRGCINGTVFSTIIITTTYAFWDHPWLGLLCLACWIWVILETVRDNGERRSLAGQLKHLQRETAANLAEGDRVAATIRDMTCPHCGRKKCE